MDDQAAAHEQMRAQRNRFIDDPRGTQNKQRALTIVGNEMDFLIEDLRLTERKYQRMRERTFELEVELARAVRSFQIAAAVAAASLLALSVVVVALIFW